MKTDAQLQTLELARLKRGNKCPHCGSNKLFVLESRPASEGTRRRKRCSACNYRSTSYEIDGSRFKALIAIEQEMAALVTAIQPLMNKVVVSQSTQTRCNDCIFNQNNRCSHDIPEYQGEESYDCFYFKKQEGEGG